MGYSLELLQQALGNGKYPHFFQLTIHRFLSAKRLVAPT